MLKLTVAVSTLASFVILTSHPKSPDTGKWIPVAVSDGGHKLWSVSQFTVITQGDTFSYRMRGENVPGYGEKVSGDEIASWESKVTVSCTNMSTQITSDIVYGRTGNVLATNVLVDKSPVSAPSGSVSDLIVQSVCAPLKNLKSV